MPSPTRTVAAVGCTALVASTALTSAALAAGGDDAFTATEITALPFADTGDTSDGTFSDQFDVVCPFTGSTSPDAWYRYTPDAPMALTIELCNSAYDTKTYVLDADFNDLGCNDDACTSPSGGTFRSLLESVVVPGGDIAYVVVDGWSGDAGVYDLTVTGGEPPEECMAAADCTGIDEGEPCTEDPEDLVNGGCNSSPPILMDVTCGDTVCGTTWALGGSRDTDWFDVAPIDTDALVRCTVTVEFDAALFFLGVNPKCSSVAILIANEPQTCETVSIEVDVSAGANHWWALVPIGFDGLPCAGAIPQDNDYAISWACFDSPPCPTLGDLDEDGAVGFSDILIVLANWGSCP